MKTCLTFTPAISIVDLDFGEEEFTEAYAEKEEEVAVAHVNIPLSYNGSPLVLPVIETIKEQHVPIVHVGDRSEISLPSIKYTI